jgi:K+ transporter
MKDHQASAWFKQGRQNARAVGGALFAAMQRNSAHVSEYFKLPRDAVVEIGREVAI